MAVPLLGKLLIGGVFGGGLYALFGGGGGGDSPRGPYVDDIRRPGTPQLPWTVVDEALCLSFDAVGAADSQRLLDALVARLYPGVPFPPIDGDHPSVREVYIALGGRVSAFVNRVQTGLPVCAQPEPDEPDEPGGPDEPPPPPPPGAANIEDYITGKPGGFKAITAGMNPTTFVAQAYGIPMNATGRLRGAIACVATVGYNLLFTGVPRGGDDYGRGRTDGRWYDVNRAFVPQHADPRIVAAEGGKLNRWIGWQGGFVQNNPGRFPLLWVPPMLAVANSLVCSPSGTWNPARNPPPEVLARLGWTLASMEAAWKESGIAGPEA